MAARVLRRRPVRAWRSVTGVRAGRTIEPRNRRSGVLSLRLGRVSTVAVHVERRFTGRLIVISDLTGMQETDEPLWSVSEPTRAA